MKKLILKYPFHKVTHAEEKANEYNYIIVEKGENLNFIIVITDCIFLYEHSFKKIFFKYYQLK